MPREIHLSLALDAAAPPAEVIESARIAERGLFDALLSPALPTNGLETTTLLGHLAVATSRVGLVTAVSPQFTAPFNQARYISTLDHLSKGRAGWNLVQTGQDTAAELHGASTPASESERYSRADEFAHVLGTLWENWDPDAVVADKTSGVYVRRESIHAADHRGEHFAVAGPFNLPRSPQVHPPLYVSVGSAESARFATDRARVAVLGAETPRAAVQGPSVVRELRVSDSAVGTLADVLIDLSDREDLDGFVLRAGIDQLRAVVDEVVPQLRAAGRYRSDYPGTTLTALVSTAVGATL